MTTRPTPSNVVVLGVDGSDANLGALRYAVAEARTTAATLKLVHVVPDYLAISPLLPVTPSALADTGSEILRAAEARVRGLDPDLPVDSWLHHGTRPAQLVEAAEAARLLVVGRDARPLAERLLRGDTAAGAAARSAVPVVEVPADWRPRPAGDPRVVVVGVKVPGDADVLLADAFAVAHERAATLVVLHAWKLPSAYDDIVASRTACDDWTWRSTLQLEELLRGHREAYPDVKVEVRIEHDHAAHALVEASREADVVVLARRARGIPVATHLGGTARAVLRSAHCPVRVVAPVPRG